jgi:hypothetical protein
MKAGRQNWNEYVLSCLLPNQLSNHAAQQCGPPGSQAGRIKVLQISDPSRDAPQQLGWHGFVPQLDAALI